MSAAHPEAAEQCALFEWAQLARGRYPQLQLMFAIPNGGKRNASEAAHLKRQGVKPGVPDIFLPMARGGYNGLFIELKRRQGGRLSEYQRAYLDALAREGYRTAVCNGACEAIETIEAYLAMREKR